MAIRRMQQRRLAAIMFTDIVGYTALMGESEKKAFRTINTNREIHKRLTEKYHGKIVKELGDGLLMVFENGTEAVLCAIDIQKEASKNQISLRIGIHEGEVVFENDDVFGDGVNIASRIQEEAAPGGVCISDTVNRIIRNNENLMTDPLGRRKLKNVNETIKLFQIKAEGISIHTKIKVQKMKIWHLIIAILLSFVLGWLINSKWNFKNEVKIPNHLNISLPENTPLFEYAQSSIDISPDSRIILFVSVVNGKSQIYKRLLSDSKVYPVKGTENAIYPFFSYDGKWIGFFADGKLKKILVSGGNPITLCDATNHSDAIWLPNGDIIFGVPGVGLKYVSGDGGDLQTLVSTNWEEGEWRYSNPAFSSDHDLLFYSVSNIDCQSSKIVCNNIKTKEQKILIKNASNANYLPNGYLAYFQNGSLMAAPFDPENIEMTGPGKIIIENYINTNRCSGPGINVSLKGTLVYLSGISNSFILSKVDFKGNSKPIYTGNLIMYGPKYSPDGKAIAMVRAGKKEINSHVWIYNVERSVIKKLTVEGSNFWPIWTPDGNYVTYPSMIEVGSIALDIYWKGVMGNTKAQRLTKSNFWLQPLSWSNDGKTLIFHHSTSRSSQDWGIRYINMDSSQIITTYIDSDFNEKWPALSPDGNLIAYSSDETGRYEIYVSTFPEIKFKQLISIAGGTEPVWSKDGKALYYRNNNKMMKVAIEIKPNFNPGKPILLFDEKFDMGGYGINYDISPDGNHFLMIKSELPNPEALNDINIIQNFFEEVERKMIEQ